MTDVNNQRGPDVWSPRELKEWLAENRVYYKGIPEKDELVVLVKRHWRDTKQKEDTITSYVDEFVKYLESYATAGKEVTKENANALAEEIAKNAESIRIGFGITEDKMASVFDQVKSRMSGAKDETSKQISSTFNDISRSYASAKSKRDEIINEGTKRIAADYKKTKKVSQDTIQWLNDRVDELSKAPGFAKSRVQTQTILILRGIEENLVSTMKTSTKDVEKIANQLSSALGEPYGKTKNIFKRIGSGIYNTIAGTWRAVVYVKRKVVDGTEYTINRIIAVKNGVAHFVGRITGRAKKTALETKQAQQERFAYLTDYLRDTVKSSKEPIAKVLANVENRIVTTEKLTKDQAKVVQETLKEKLGNIKDAKDLTEDRINDAINALCKKFTSTGDDRCCEKCKKYEQVEQIVKSEL
ncbi:2017_t:CDS:2 [Paraglomus brasilianum]|uniref:2017_t:CDS:1 n=1 Tax=Paraglomus brasilianum TaxID=144538 RepID=A0A9N8WHC2_9GLOM|nr:2017_t:CDS:2 [Paraglomus brasilianum]